MRKACVFVVLAALAVGGCATVKPAIMDPVGNLTGDKGRQFLDIVQSDLALKDGVYTFSATMAAPFPSPAEMRDKRFDIVWFIDADQNTRTGQSELGNDYNLHAWLDGDGWHPSWYKVSPVSKNDGIHVELRDFRIEVKGAKGSISFPERYLHAWKQFDWWVFSTSKNAPQWTPQTGNPATVRSTFVRPGK